MKQIALPVRENLNALAQHLNSVLVERSKAVTAIIYGMLTEQHVMLEGVPGVAKSMLASSVFGSISDATVFEKQFMKGTRVEEIFGPLNLARYQKESIWEHNTKGKLPSAHFAYLDEVYRASDSLLPACLGILNERRFENGDVIVKCPLICAIGTTNFTTVSEELIAFNDRWTIWVGVESLSAINSRIKMLNGFLGRLTSDATVKSFLSLSDLQYAIKEIKTIEADKEVTAAYATLCSTLAKSLNLTISDRRFCLAFRIAQAAAYMRGLDVVDAEALAETAYGLIKRGDTKQEDAFAKAFEQVVGSIKRGKEEDNEAVQLEDNISRLTSAFNENMKPDRLEKLHAKTQEFMSILASRTEDFVRSSNEEAFKSVKKRTDELLLSIRETMQQQASKGSRPAQNLIDADVEEPTPVTPRGRPSLSDLIKGRG